jgi:hypothetical protein
MLATECGRVIAVLEVRMGGPEPGAAYPALPLQWKYCLLRERARPTRIEPPAALWLRY